MKLLIQTACNYITMVRSNSGSIKMRIEYLFNRTAIELSNNNQMTTKMKWIQVYACNSCDNTSEIGMDKCFFCDEQVCFDCWRKCEGCAKYGVCPECDATATEFKNDGTDQDDPHRIKVHGNILCGSCIYDLVIIEHSIGCNGTPDGKGICCDIKRSSYLY